MDVISGSLLLLCLHSKSVYEVDINDYKRETVLNLSQAWKLAQDNIQRVQEQQKK